MSNVNPNFTRDFEYLASFLGPQAENRGVFEELMVTVLRDYVHWRANYYPGDGALLTPQLERDLIPATDSLKLYVHQMMANLRRNFPFYSPRYLGHMLSDTSMPSMIGYFAGMLFNPNNVTTEAAPVTVEWELDACNTIMQMLGFKSPPTPEPEESAESYLRRVRQADDFGWAHLAFDGTTATIEAIWVARTVRYLPLAIREASASFSPPLDVYLPDGTQKPLPEIDEYRLLLIRPTDAIRLLDDYVHQYVVRGVANAERGIDQNLKTKLRTKAWNKLRECNSDIVTKGCSGVFARFQPKIFATGAAHYCVSKACDLLGIGAANIVQLDMDNKFRMDIKSLQKHLDETRDAKQVPLIVFAVCGSTEEGAVDPVHLVLDERKRREATNMSFWIHADAAWAGYIRSLFNWTKDEVWEEALLEMSDDLQLGIKKGDTEWAEDAYKKLYKRINKARRQESVKQIKSNLHDTAYRAQRAYSGDTKGISEAIERLVNSLSAAGIDVRDPFAFDDARILRIVRGYVNDNLDITWKNQTHPVPLNWNTDDDVMLAFLSMRDADSIVCDPHKMGYIVYPAGMVAFRDNRVRQVIRQKAPYITALGGEEDLKLPPRYKKQRQPSSHGGASLTDADNKSDSLVVEAFARFILEGSRPGAAAASLWLATKCIPPTIKKHGSIVRSSLLAARELYEMLVKSSEILQAHKENVFRFLPISPTPPDTNVVTFVVRAELLVNLQWLNLMTERVYNQFAIRAEVGDRRYSYGQPFFLSNHVLSPPEYSFDFIRRILKERADIDVGKDEFDQEGKVHVLRVVAMNPYLWPLETYSQQELVKEFLDALYEAATKAYDGIHDEQALQRRRA